MRCLLFRLTEQGKGCCLPITSFSKDVPLGWAGHAVKDTGHHCNNKIVSCLMYGTSSSNWLAASALLWRSIHCTHHHGNKNHSNNDKTWIYSNQAWKPYSPILVGLLTKPQRKVWVSAWPAIVVLLLSVSVRRCIIILRCCPWWDHIIGNHGHIVGGGAVDQKIDLAFSAALSAWVWNCFASSQDRLASSTASSTSRASRLMRPAVIWRLSKHPLLQLYDMDEVTANGW